MVQFNELRITPDGKHLIIDVLVEPLSYYDNVYIDSIHIDTQDTFIETGPSSKPIFSYVVPEELPDSSKECLDNIIEILERNDTGVKHLRFILDIDIVRNNLFFVWVLTKGTPSECTPCGMKELMILGVVYNELPLLLNAIKLLNGLDECTLDKAFINFILESEGFNLAIKTGNYTKAIEYWNKLFVKKNPIFKNHCGCHGAIR